MQSLNRGFPLAENSSLESCASSEALPYGALKILAHDSRQLRCFVGLGHFSLSSPSAFLWTSKSGFIQTRPRRGCVCGGLVAVPAEPREAPGLVTPQGVPAVPWPMCSCRLAERGTGTEGLSWTGRPTGALAPGRLEQPGTGHSQGSCPTVPIIRLPLLPDTTALLMGFSWDHRDTRLLWLLGFLLLFLFPWLIFWFFNTTPNKHACARRHSGIIFFNCLLGRSWLFRVAEKIVERKAYSVWDKPGYRASDNFTDICEWIPDELMQVLRNLG